ncbi:MAG: DUF4837 family protein [Bacteroidales bacterium]|nr:DUF4837 family protein [Bacteroidales bacterium]
MRTILKTTAILAMALALVGCKHKERGALLPNVSGKAGEIVVVIDKDNWEGNIGTELREILAVDCPYLAQREPLFTLANVPPGSFNNMFKMHRNILILNINPQNQKEAMLYKRDQWARPQSLAQINAFTEEGALAVLAEAKEQLPEFFEQAERDRIIANSILYEELTLRDPVEKLTGGILHFPSGYKLRKATDDFVWIADEKQYTNQTVLVYRYPVPDEAPFDVENIIAKRNEIMQANVPGMFDGTFMTTSTAVQPETRSLKYHGLDFMETRGFWEVQGDFMGGPFVSHSFYSPDGKDIIVLEAFVYAPKYDKRQYLRQVESILYSFEWKNNEK